MKTSELLKTLSSSTKAKIVYALYNSKVAKTVTELCDSIKSKQPNMSKHLMDLRKLDIVEYEKEGKESYYLLSKDFINQHGKMVEYIGQNAIGNEFYSAK